MSAARRASNERGVPRWVAWCLGLAAVGAAAWAFASGRSGPGGPPLDDIDAASRQRLDQVLREAENDPAARP